MKIGKLFGVIGLAIFVYLLLKLDFEKFGATISNMKIWWILPTIIFFIISIIINAARWQYISNKMGIGLTLKDATIITFKAMFGENSPGKMGEIFVRATYMKTKTGASFGKAFFSTAFSRFVDIWVTAIEAILAVVVLALLFGLRINIIILPILGLFIIIIMFFLIKNEKIVLKVSKIGYKLIMPKVKASDFETNFESFYGGLRKINAKMILVCLFYDLLALLAVAFSFYFLGLCLNIDFPIYLAILAEPLITIAVALPISFSGLGTREAVFAYLFSLKGISLEKAITFSLLFFAIRLVLMVPGIIALLVDREKAN